MISRSVAVMPPEMTRSYQSILRNASELGLDEGQFASCYESRRFKSEIAEDIRDAARFGARGTPNFFLNGRQIVGAQPFQVFAQFIEQELAKEVN